MPADHPVGRVTLSVPPGVPIAEACPLPVQHRNPEAIAGDWAAPRLPGPGTYLREPSQKPSSSTGLGGAFILTPSSLSEAASLPLLRRPVPTLLGDSPNLESCPSPILPYVTAPPPPQAPQASTHRPAPIPLLLGYWAGADSGLLRFQLPGLPNSLFFAFRLLGSEVMEGRIVSRRIYLDSSELGCWHPALHDHLQTC